MFEILNRAEPGALSPDTRKAVVRSSVKFIADELRAMAAALPEVPAEQLAKLEAALLEAQGAIDVFKDQCGTAGAVALDVAARKAGAV